MYTNEFYDDVIFKGLTNHNDGFDAPTIQWFSKEDFDIVLKRASENKLFISAIEHFPLESSDDCRTYYPVDQGSVAWYFTEFANLVEEGRTNLFSVSFSDPQDFFDEMSECQDRWLYE
jgi:hypothetical protein